MSNSHSYITNNRGSSTILGEKLKKESKKKKYQRLKEHRWGMGLEHETQFFHEPLLDNKKPINSFIMFDAKPSIHEVLKNGNISIIEREFLSTIPFEPTGRKCNGKIVLKKTPVPMPEFVTGNPMSSLKSGKKPIEYYVQELQDKERLFYNLLNQSKRAKKLKDKYGSLVVYPYGMTNYMKYPKSEKGDVYKFEKTKSGNDVMNTDYLGSYHITLTLPFTAKMSLDKFIKMHQNFANQIQWIEPLLVTAFFSSDQKAVGTTEKRIKGSYRVVRIGWGNFAGSDVRKFNKGVGRYSNIKTYWRDGLDFYNMDKTEYCKRLAPELRKKEPGAISGYSSNFRTFGSTDPERPWHRESGKGMTKPNGVELRIFDHFDSYYLDTLCRLVIYVAENSRVTNSTKYVYENKDWIKALQNIMLRGWNAEIPEGYVKDLRKQLGLKINTKSLVAYDVLKVINEELWKKNKSGDWSYLMLDKEYKEAPRLPEINRLSWQMGAMIKFNREPKLLKKLNDFIDKIPKKTDMNGMGKVFYKYFEKNKWNMEDMIYFLESLGYVEIKKNERGKIVEIEKGKEDEKINNFNYFIRNEFYRGILEEYHELEEKVKNMK